METYSKIYNASHTYLNTLKGPIAGINQSNDYRIAIFFSELTYQSAVCLERGRTILYRKFRQLIREKRYRFHFCCTERRQVKLYPVQCPEKIR